MPVVIRGIYEIGVYPGRATPVPIPNTAVKSVRADGTNTQFGVGRVGQCRSRRSLEVEKNMRVSRFWLQGLVSLLAILLSGASSQAQTIASSARHMEQGSWRLSVYHQGAINEDLEFDVGSSGTCSSPNAPVATFACGSTGTVTAEGDSEAGIAKLTFQPYERMQYYIAGGVGNYRLKASTLSARGDNLGTIMGGGFKALIMSESLVTPAIALDAGFSFERYILNRSNGGLATIDERLELFRTQIAVEGSKRFEIDDNITLEPYGGLKWLRTRAVIKDLIVGDRQSGVQNTLTPFVGLSLPLFKSEGFFVEADFVNGIHYAAGLTVGFGASEKKG